MIELRTMERDRSVPIRSHGKHVSERNKHLIKAGMATVGAAVAAGVHPAAGVAVGLAALYEFAGAIDHHEERRKRR